MAKLLLLSLLALASCAHAFVVPSATRCSVRTLRAAAEDEELQSDDSVYAPIPFDPRSTATLLGGQALLIAFGPAAGALAGTANYGLGDNFAASFGSLADGFLYTLPLVVLVVVLDVVERSVPALKDVTTATHRSVLAMLGGTFTLPTTLAVAAALGLIAGVGEEWLFRGVLQTKLGPALSQNTPLAIAITSVVFGALHAVTPLYAALATLASVYFGCVFLWADQNLLVPMATHAIYDFGALVYAHYEVSKLTPKEQYDIALWTGPMADTASTPESQE